MIKAWGKLVTMGIKDIAKKIRKFVMIDHPKSMSDKGYWYSAKGFNWHLSQFFSKLFLFKKSMISAGDILLAGFNASIRFSKYLMSYSMTISE